MGQLSGIVLKLKQVMSILLLASGSALAKGTYSIVYWESQKFSQLSNLSTTKQLKCTQAFTHIASQASNRTFTAEVKP